EHELALLAGRERRARRRIDDLREEVVLVDVEALPRLHALRRHAGADQLREPVEVERRAAPETFELGPHRFGPRLRTEEAIAETDRPWIQALLAHGLGGGEGAAGGVG